MCVNEGDVYLNGTQQVSYVSCIDTVSQKVGSSCTEPSEHDAWVCCSSSATWAQCLAAGMHIAFSKGVAAGMDQHCSFRPGCRHRLLRADFGLQFISRVAVGGKPVHLYWVAETATMWSHSDAEGTFYVIRLADTSLVNTTVPVRPCHLSQRVAGYWSNIGSCLMGASSPA